MPWKTYKDGEQWCVYQLNADGSKGERVACHEHEDDAQAQVRSLYANEMGGSVNDKLILTEQVEHVNNRVMAHIAMVFEMKGGYPAIPLPPDIDVEGIKAQGRRFVTLPIGKVDAESRNGRTYRRPAVEQLVQQVNEKRPEGGWGHIKTEDMGTAYGPPAIRWLAAKIDRDGVAWGKGLPLTADAAQYFDDARLTNARTGTSLHSWIEVEGESDVVGMELLRLDLADPARVGIPATAAKPQMSTEMDEPAKERNMPQAQETSGLAKRLNGAIDKMVADGMTREEVISKMASAAGIEASTVNQILNNSIDMPPEDRLRGFANALNLPLEELMRLAGHSKMEESQMDRVAELEVERKELKREVSEMEKAIKTLTVIREDAQEVREMLGIGADDDFVKSARAYVERHEELQAENASLLESAMKALIAEKVAIEAMRPMVMELVKAEKPLTRKELDKAIGDVLGRASVKAALEVKLAEEMGPAQTTPADNDKQEDDWKQFVNIPAREKAGA